MAEQFTVSTCGRTGGNGKLIAICATVGLLVGAGVVTPFALNYRSSMQRAQQEAIEAAARAEQNKNEAIALEKQKGELRENLGQAEKTITTLRDDLTTRSTALDALKQTDATRTKEVETLRADIQKKAAAMAELDGRVKDARAEVENATKENADLVGKVNGLRVELSRMTETIQTQGVEITRLSEAVKQEEAAKTVALQQAAQQQQRAEVAEVKVEKTTQDLMALAPVRIEERHSTKTGRKIGEKSGVPFGAVFDVFGDIFTGVGEATLGKSGPVELVGVYKDGREEKLAQPEAAKWQDRGVKIVKLARGE
jgi:chromosome segregation ATPase